MKIYLAGKTQAYQEVKLIQKLCRTLGHEITYDWTKVIEEHGGDSNEVDIAPEKRTEYAQSDLSGVYRCDLLIAVGHPHLSGTLWECGMATITGSRVWLVLWERYGRRSIFEDLPNVEHVPILELGNRLWELSPKRLELEPSSVRISVADYEQWARREADQSSVTFSSSGATSVGHLKARRDVE